MPESIRAAVDSIAREGGTPLVVAEGSRILGAVRLKDVLKAEYQGAPISPAIGWHSLRHDHGRQSHDGSSHRRGGWNR